MGGCDWIFAVNNTSQLNEYDIPKRRQYKLVLSTQRSLIEEKENKHRGRQTTSQVNTESENIKKLNELPRKSEKSNTTKQAQWIKEVNRIEEFARSTVRRERKAEFLL